MIPFIKISESVFLYNIFFRFYKISNFVTILLLPPPRGSAKAHLCTFRKGKLLKQLPFGVEDAPSFIHCCFALPSTAITRTAQSRGIAFDDHCCSFLNVLEITSANYNSYS